MTLRVGSMAREAWMKEGTPCSSQSWLQLLPQFARPRSRVSGNTYNIRWYKMIHLAGRRSLSPLGRQNWHTVWAVNSSREITATWEQQTIWKVPQVWRELEEQAWPLLHGRDLPGDHETMAVGIPFRQELFWVPVLGCGVCVLTWSLIRQKKGLFRSLGRLSRSKLMQLFTSPRGRAMGHRGFRLVLDSVSLCFPLSPISFCVPTIKTVCTSHITSCFSYGCRQWESSPELTTRQQNSPGQERILSTPVRMPQQGATGWPAWIDDGTCRRPWATDHSMS